MICALLTGVQTCALPISRASFSAGNSISLSSAMAVMTLRSHSVDSGDSSHEGRRDLRVAHDRLVVLDGVLKQGLQPLQVVADPRQEIGGGGRHALALARPESHDFRCAVEIGRAHVELQSLMRTSSAVF